MVDFSVQAFESKKKPVLVNQSTEMEQKDDEEIKIELTETLVIITRRKSGGQE